MVGVSWHRHERETIRQAAQAAGAGTELHFLDAPPEELVRRVRQCGGPEAETLAAEVLMKHSGNFEKPTSDETALFGRYVGPEMDQH